MAGDSSSTPAPAPAPAPPTPTTGPTATWGTQHFDKAPTQTELAQQSTSQQAQQPSSATPTSSATKQQQSATVTDAVKSIKPGDFLTVYQIPCARTGFLTGIGGGAAIGGLRYILGASIPKAANWAVGAFAAGSIIAFEVCQASRRAEAAKMKRVVEVYDRKQAELQQQKAQKAREAAAAALQEKMRLEEEARAATKRWYRFW